MPKRIPGNPIITADELRHLIDYDPDTGIFRWRSAPAAHLSYMVGKIAGTIDKRRRRFIVIGSRAYQAHRLAWLYMHGRWPTRYIDHANRDCSDNRFCNLREATPSQNQANRGSVPNKSGMAGVFFDVRHKAWRAQVTVRGKRIFLGRFPSAEEANAVYRAAKVRAFGEFACVD